MIATVIAKLLGMLRGVLQMAFYGTSLEADAFTAASKLPLAAFDMLLSAAVLGCFIPVYNSFAKKDGKDDPEADRFASVFLSFIILVCSIMALIGILFAEPLIRLMAGGLSEETIGLAVRLTRIMFPMIIFTGAAYTLVGVLQSKGSFILPAMISAISNAGVVLYLLIVNNRLGSGGIYGLAIAYVVSWFIQLFTLVVPLVKKKFSFSLIFDFKNSAFRRAVKMIPPVMIGSWLAPAGTILGQFFAAKVAAAEQTGGASTVFDGANNVYIIIAGTLTYSICNYTFPKISRLAAEGDKKGFSETVRGGLVSALYIVMPIMAAALVLAGEGISILYLRGKFTPDDALRTASVLTAILPAMPFFCITELFSRVFFSKKMVKIPMAAALCGIAGNIAAGVGLILVGGAGIYAVGIANAVGQLASASVLIICAAVKMPEIFKKSLGFDILKLIGGGVLVFSVCLLMSRLIGSSPYTSSTITNIVNAAGIFAPAVIVYLIYSKIIGLGFRKSTGGSDIG